MDPAHFSLVIIGHTSFAIFKARTLVLIAMLHDQMKNVKWQMIYDQ
jgi:hypothetical protein